MVQCKQRLVRYGTRLDDIELPIISYFTYADIYRVFLHQVARFFGTRGFQEHISIPIEALTAEKVQKYLSNNQ